MDATALKASASRAPRCCRRRIPALG